MNNRTEQRLQQIEGALGLSKKSQVVIRFFKDGREIERSGDGWREVDPARRNADDDDATHVINLHFVNTPDSDSAIQIQ